jgi:ferrous iron transport protein A
MTPLSKMFPGQQGTVIGFTVESKVSRRLLEMGIVPGRTVVYLRKAPLRDPMEVQVGSCCLSLRHSEAALVTVRLEK